MGSAEKITDFFPIIFVFIFSNFPKYMPQMLSVLVTKWAKSNEKIQEKIIIFK
jgi:hypothetical protein